MQYATVLVCPPHSIFYGVDLLVEDRTWQRVILSEERVFIFEIETKFRILSGLTGPYIYKNYIMSASSRKYIRGRRSSSKSLSL